MHQPNGIVCRSCTIEDREACLSIFDSNTPRFFDPSERYDFERFLDAPMSPSIPYLVLVIGTNVVACGGLSLDREGRQASFSWGMVARSLHGKGLGTRLTQERLTQARGLPQVEYLVLSTSQHTAHFYERFGFRVSSISKDGFGPGLNRYDMTLHLR